MDDGCLDMSRAFHVGCRGSVKSPEVLREDRDQGWTTIGGSLIRLSSSGSSLTSNVKMSNHREGFGGPVKVKSQEFS